LRDRALANDYDVKEILDQVKVRGYFDPGDFPGLSLPLNQYHELMQLIKKHGYLTKTVSDSSTKPTKKESINIINSLRKGVPPRSIDVSLFSVGRGNVVERFRKDLKAVENDYPSARFMNADWGSGKTHSLLLLREIAFRSGFVVSIVTLSQASCPLYDFMQVYHQIMWNLRTSDERDQPAMENVLTRWLQTINEIGQERAKAIIGKLPQNLVQSLHSYHESVSPLIPDEGKRLSVLKYLSGDTISSAELRRINIKHRIDSSNALNMLSNMAALFRNLKYKGICILFDEAESIHSFAQSNHRDQAYKNILQVIQQSTKTKCCYFFYATTPSFFDNYFQYLPPKAINSNDIVELDRLGVKELQKLAAKICEIYAISKNVNIPSDVLGLLKRSSLDPTFSETIGNFVRRCIAVLDDKT